MLILGGATDLTEAAAIAPASVEGITGWNGFPPPVGRNPDYHWSIAGARLFVCCTVPPHPSPVPQPSERQLVKDSETCPDRRLAIVEWVPCEADPRLECVKIRIAGHGARFGVSVGSVRCNSNSTRLFASTGLDIGPSGARDSQLSWSARASRPGRKRRMQWLEWRSRNWSPDQRCGSLQECPAGTWRWIRTQTDR